MGSIETRKQDICEGDGRHRSRGVRSSRHLRHGSRIRARSESAQSRFRSSVERFSFILRDFALLRLRRVDELPGQILEAIELRFGIGFSGIGVGCAVPLPRSCASLASRSFVSRQVISSFRSSVCLIASTGTTMAIPALSRSSLSKCPLISPMRATSLVIESPNFDCLALFERAGVMELRDRVIGKTWGTAEAAARVRIEEMRDRLRVPPTTLSDHANVALIPSADPTGSHHRDVAVGHRPNVIEKPYEVRLFSESAAVGLIVPATYRQRPNLR